jgi:hypothetical protein
MKLCHNWRNAIWRLLGLNWGRRGRGGKVHRARIPFQYLFYLSIFWLLVGREINKKIGIFSKRLFGPSKGIKMYALR